MKLDLSLSDAHAPFWKQHEEFNRFLNVLALECVLGITIPYEPDPALGEFIEPRAQAPAASPRSALCFKDLLEAAALAVDRTADSEAGAFLE